MWLGAPSALRFAFPDAAFFWREAEVFNFICAESIQEIFLKSECPYEKRIMPGIVNLINLNPGSTPGVKPCSIPAIWTNVRAKAANPTRQLPLDKTLPLCSKIRGKA